MRALTAVLTIFLFSVSVSTADNISGTWSTRGEFTLTFGADGSYRAENTDQQFCSLCAGGGPLVETGTYTVKSGMLVITIASSNGPNKDMRIGKPMTVPFQFAGESATFGNAQKLTLDWVTVESIEMTQKTTAVERKTWRAVKELFR